ncbi:MAG: LacI family DNA-binding transcriptional regulator [Verrucomicrobia bacterium]|nr:LacI family DNA-binding transcriptional regulator [Verrucomicrobiota bacterium]
MTRLPTSGQKKYPTMNDVAAVVGVHPTTVSLALRSHPSIPLATRTRILNAVREIGYIRDPLLDAFNYHRCSKHTSKQSPSIAFVADSNSAPYFNGSAYHPFVYEGVRAVADPQHLSLEIFSLGNNGLTPNRLNTILTSRGITGILLSTFTLATKDIELDWGNFSTVKIESHHLLPQIDVVSNDQCQAARLCMRKLREAGYRRIGLATALDDETRLQDNFSSGVLVEQAELPAAECVPPLLFKRAEITEIATRIATWVKENDVDVIMTNWNEFFREATWLTAEGIRFPTNPPLHIPRDVAFASLDAPADRPQIAGIVQNHRLVGMRAMEHLEVLVKTYQRGAPKNPSGTYVPGYWRDGATAPKKVARRTRVQGATL